MCIKSAYVSFTREVTHTHIPAELNLTRMRRSMFHTGETHFARSACYLSSYQIYVYELQINFWSIELVNVTSALLKTF